MAVQASTLRELAQIRADNREFLNLIVGSQGTALGRKNFDLNDNPAGDPCIIIYIPHKINSALLSNNATIPKKLTSNDGKLEAPTDVVVTTIPNIEKSTPTLTTENRQLINTLQWLDGQLDHIPSGAQIGAGTIEDDTLSGYVGTIGYIVHSVKNPNVVGILTNQHVGAHSGHSLYIPGYSQQAFRLGITRKTVEYIPDDEWIQGIDEKYAFVRCDAAFIEIESNLVHLLRNIVPGVGRMGEPFQIDLDSMDIIGMPVKKVGRTTGLQQGTVVAFGYGITSEEDYLDRRLDKEPANFYTDLVIGPRSTSTIFSAGGDSGSAILLDTDDENSNRPVALLWGGRKTDIGRRVGLEDLTYGVDLMRVLNLLDLEIH